MFVFVSFCFILSYWPVSLFLDFSACLYFFSFQRDEMPCFVARKGIEIRQDEDKNKDKTRQTFYRPSVLQSIFANLPHKFMAFKQIYIHVFSLVLFLTLSFSCLSFSFASSCCALLNLSCLVLQCCVVCCHLLCCVGLAGVVLCCLVWLYWY